jgi:hypothetical protein
MVLLLFTSSACKGSPKGLRVLHAPYFSIQYPKTWKSIRADYHYSFNGPVEQNYVVNLKVDYNPEANLALNLFRETVESQNQITALPGYISITEKELNIQGVPALQRIIKTDVVLSANDQVTLMVILTYLVKDKVGVVLTAEIPEASYLSYNLLLNDMIQSFRFK